MNLKVRDLAKICYEAVKSYAETQNDHHHRRWNNLAEEHKQTLVDGVLFHITNPEAGPEAAHLMRCSHLMEKGWRWGPVKAIEDRQSPLLVAFDNLSGVQQMKYLIFCTMAVNLARFVEDGPQPVEQEQRQVGVGGAAEQGEPDTADGSSAQHDAVGSPNSSLTSNGASTRESSASQTSESGSTNGEVNTPTTPPTPSDTSSKEPGSETAADSSTMTSADTASQSNSGEMDNSSASTRETSLPSDSEAA